MCYALGTPLPCHAEPAFGIRYSCFRSLPLWSLTENSFWSPGSEGKRFRTWGTCQGKTMWMSRDLVSTHQKTGTTPHTFPKGFHCSEWLRRKKTKIPKKESKMLNEASRYPLWVKGQSVGVYRGDLETVESRDSLFPTRKRLPRSLNSCRNLYSHSCALQCKFS